MRHKLLRTVLPITLLSAVSLAKAGDLFVVDVETTSGGALSKSVGDSSLLDLVEKLIERKGQFQEFDNRDIEGSITYAGVRNALVFSLNDAHTEATLTIPSTGFTKTFTGDDKNDLEDQIEDFLKKDGADEFAAFLKEMNRRSLVAVTDGNPQATTARMAGSAFERFSLNPTFIATSPSTANNQLRGSQFRFDIKGGTIDTDHGDGTFVDFSLASGYRFNEGVALTLTTVGGYRDIEGADVFDLGFDIGVPISIIPPRGDANLNWTVTPFAQVGMALSPDYLAGGILGGAGIANHVALQLGLTTISMGNQISFYEGVPIKVGDYDFDTDITQQVLKNSLKLSQQLSATLFADVSLTHSMFLEDAAVEDWISPGVGIGSNWDGGGMRIGYQGDLGDDYTAHSLQFNLYFLW